MTRGPVLVVFVLALLGLDECVQPVRDRTVGAVGPVLVEQRCPFVVVAHPCHQVPE